MSLKSILKLIVFVVVTIIISSCSTDDEPVSTIAAASTTRSVSSGNSKTYNLSEIRSIADAKLAKLTRQNVGVSINPVCVTDSSLRSNLLSDTIAFIVNYQNNGGFVVIANDRRVDPILAWGDKGNIKDNNPYVRSLFLDNIQNYLASVSDDGLDKSKSVTNAPIRRFIVDPMVNEDVKLCPAPPFIDKVREHHEWAFPSMPVIAATTILAATQKTLTYTTTLRKSIMHISKEMVLIHYNQEFS